MLLPLLKAMPRPPSKAAGGPGATHATLETIARRDGLPWPFLTPQLLGDALCHAVAAGSVPAARLLLAWGADPNAITAVRDTKDAKTFRFHSPLIIAAATGDLEMAEALLAAGALPNRALPFDDPEPRECERVADWLAERPRRYVPGVASTAAAAAVAARGAAMLRLLCAHGASGACPGEADQSLDFPYHPPYQRNFVIQPAWAVEGLAPRWAVPGATAAAVARGGRPGGLSGRCWAPSELLAPSLLHFALHLGYRDMVDVLLEQEDERDAAGAPRRPYAGARLGCPPACACVAALPARLVCLQARTFAPARTALHPHDPSLCWLCRRVSSGGWLPPLAAAAQGGREE